MSSRLDRMADSGRSMIAQWEAAGEVANAAMDGISGAVTAAVSTVDGIAVSIADVRNELDAMGDGWERELDAANMAKAGIEEVSASADMLAETICGYGDAIGEAAARTDVWTAAVGNYDKGMLEAVYTTEELVEKGFKSIEALKEQERMFDLCGKSANSLNKSITAATGIQNELSAAIEKASAAAAGLSGNEVVSARTKVELARAGAEAAEAMNELSRAQEEAAAAMEAYDAVMSSGVENLKTLESAAERACHASEALAEANGKASNAAGELSEAAEKASEEAEESGIKGAEAVEALADALVAAGISTVIKEIAEAAYGLAEAFSEAESTVVLATGATGDVLDGLTESMMEAYAASKMGSLDEAAAAIGEINTRLGYTDGVLTETTGLFLDFAAVTGGDVASSVRSVTQLMNQWNVPADEMEEILDRLAYAGQASGISVDGLSQQLITNKAILDQLGFSLDEATAMFMNFELAGTNIAAVMTGFRTALSSGAVSSLDELYEVFDQISNGAVTAAEASEMFGSRAGPAIVNAVNSGVLSLEDMVASLEASDGTLATTAESAQTLGQKWQQASNNISTAFTTAVQPALDRLSGGFADLMNGVGNFLNEHPTFTKVLTAAGIGIGVVAVGITGVAFASKVAIPAVTAFGTAFNEALGPIGWVALGITAVKAAVIAFSIIADDAVDVTERLTASSQEQADELERLNAEYDAACNEFGQGSDEAIKLRGEVELLSDSFEKNRQTIGDLLNGVDELRNKIDEIQNTYEEAVASSDEFADYNMGLIAELAVLQGNSSHTTAELEMMNDIVNRLNDSYDGLNLTLDETNGKLNMSTEDLWRAALEQNEQEKAQANIDSLIGFLGQYQDAQTKFQEANKTMNKSWEDFEKAVDENWAKEHPFLAFTGWADGAEMNWSGSAQDAYREWETMKEKTEEYEAEFNRIEDGIRSCYEQMGYSSDEIDNMMVEIATLGATSSEFAENLYQAEGAAYSYGEAAKEAFGSVRTDVEELMTAYNEAYDAARNSIDSTIGLFQEMSVECELSTQDMITALESQTAYLNQYSENLGSAADYGLDEGLIASLSDGSEESAAYLDTIISKINDLGGSTDEAKAFVDEMNRSFEDVEVAKDTFAQTVADMQTNFDEEMDLLVAKMEETVEGMGLETEAAEAARSTIQAYADAITDQRGTAVEAAKQVAGAVATALNNGSKPSAAATAKATSVVPGYAVGTTDAEDVFIAGENGPELIVGKGGSTVFPAEETERIMEAFQQPLYVPVPAGYPSEDNRQEQNGAGCSEKKITLEIAGSGAIETGGSGGADRETILEVLCDHIKPVLMNIIQSEIYEEGELSYEY